MTTTNDAPAPNAPPWLPAVANPSVSASNPDLAVNSNSVKFDPTQVQVLHQNQRWVLSEGSKILKDFGNNERDAHEAAYLVRNMKLDELTRIGSPTPSMEYWLSRGEAPHLWLTTQHVLPLDAAHLRIQMDPNLGQWTLCNNSRTVLSFGSREQDARQALEVIHKYGFTHVITVGQGVSSMLVFTGDNRPTMPGALPPSLNQPSGIVQAHYTQESPAPTFTRPMQDQQPFGQGTMAVMAQGPTLPVPLDNQPGSTLQPGPTGDLTAPAPQSAPTATHSFQRRTPALNPPADPASPAVERSVFDYRQAQVRKDNNQYVLAFGSQTIGTFGNDEQGARQALNTLHRYQLNEQYRIGGPQSQFTYYLSSGRVPLGQAFGMQSYPLDQGGLAVHHDKQGWVIANKDQPLWRFGNGAEAQQALATIQKYKFDHVCHVGDGEGTGFTFLVRTR